MFDLLKDIIRLIIKNKKFWLIPIFLVFLLFGGLLFYASGSVVAPFLYTLF